MNATRKPYEILVRYDEGGNLQGAHVVWNDIVTLDDGRVIRSQSNPEPVDIGKGRGFPVGDIISTVAADALAARDEALAGKKQAESALAEMAAVNEVAQDA